MIAASATLRRRLLSPEAEARRAEHRAAHGFLEPLEPCPPDAHRLSHRQWLKAGLRLPQANTVQLLYRRVFGQPPRRRPGPGGAAVATYSAKELAALLGRLG